MTPRLTTIRTMTQYSLARLRVLCTTRRFWSALLVSSLLVLAVIGTSAAWRARTSAEEPPVAEASFSVSPLAELIPQHTAVPAPQEATTVTSAPPVTLSTATDASTVTQRAEARDPVTATTTGGEQAQPACRQQINTTPRAVEMPERGRAIDQQRSIVARVARETEVHAHPLRPATRAPVPALPRVQVVSVSSTAVLIQHKGRRQIVRRGARLHGWTLARLAPTGVTLRRAQQHAFLPLSFAARVSNMQ
jgi:hypothetical protein